MDPLSDDEYVRSLPRKRVSAGVLFRAPDGRVLLVEPAYKPEWEIPGGTVDEGEAPWTAAVRELREELGLDRQPGRLLVIDHEPDDGRLPEGIAFVFDGGVVSEQEVADLELAETELRSTRLVTLAEATRLVAPVLARQLAAALDAVHSGELALREDGLPAR